MKGQQKLTNDTFSEIKEIFSKIAIEYIKSQDFSNNKWKKGKAVGKVSYIEINNVEDITAVSYTYNFHPRLSYGKRKVKAWGTFTIGYPNPNKVKFIVEHYSGDTISQKTQTPNDNYVLYKDGIIEHQRQFPEPINGGLEAGVVPSWVKDMGNLTENEGKELAERLTNIYNELKHKKLLASIETN